VQFLELAIVGLPGQQILGSDRVEIATIELNQDRLGMHRSLH
jgi:hypothetical protein